MTELDPQRVGGLEWTRRTGGRLTRSERGRLLAAVAIGQWENAVGRLKLALGRLPAGAKDIDASTFSPPDTKLAKQAEEACAEQPQAIIGHSYRTWMFGLALAAIDGAELDREQFYCSALVHDYGIAKPTPGRDFTLAGAERVIACAAAAEVTPDVGEEMADAILCSHDARSICSPRRITWMLCAMGGNDRRCGLALVGYRAGECRHCSWSLPSRREFQGCSRSDDARRGHGCPRRSVRVIGRLWGTARGADCPFQGLKPPPEWAVGLTSLR